MTTSDSPAIATHGLRRMDGRDPGASHRAATPLELLFDLAFVIAFGVAGSEFAHLLAEGHVATGLFGFSFAMFAVIWAWINFTWFASAYDTDDWVYRLLTMVQMIGVVVLALGLPAMFDSIDHDDTFDTRAMIFGYVVMRVPMVAQWLRAAASDPAHRRTCLVYAGGVSFTQVLWVGLAFVDLKPVPETLLALPLFALEVATPWVAERRGGREGGTPWHPHHIAERFGLLAIITLGEVLLGTVAALAAVIDHDGWNLDVALLAAAGVGLTFGLWWTYFLLPAGDILAHQRGRGFLFGYGHMLIYAALAATGAGLHVAALYLEGEATLTSTEVMWTVAVPVLVYFIVASTLFQRLAGPELRRPGVVVLKSAVVLAGVVLAAAGVALAWCVLVVALAPAVSVLDLELRAGRGDAAPADEPGG